MRIHYLLTAFFILLKALFTEATVTKAYCDPGEVSDLKNHELQVTVSTSKATVCGEHNTQRIGKKLEELTNEAMKAPKVDGLPELRTGSSKICQHLIQRRRLLNDPDVDAATGVSNTTLVSWQQNPDEQDHRELMFSKFRYHGGLRCVFCRQVSCFITMPLVFQSNKNISHQPLPP